MVAIYPGSFDPVTMGHLDVVRRASGMFARVVMAIVGNPAKKPLISLAERIHLVEESVHDLSNVEIEAFEGLTVDLARKRRATVIIRGLRAMSDFENEFAMAQMNKRLAPGINTVFLTAGLEYHFLSSGMIKELAALGGNIAGLVPEPVQHYLTGLFGECGGDGS